MCTTGAPKYWKAERPAWKDLRNRPWESVIWKRTPPNHLLSNSGLRVVVYKKNCWFSRLISKIITKGFCGLIRNYHTVPCQGHSQKSALMSPMTKYEFSCHNWFRNDKIVICQIQTMKTFKILWEITTSCGDVQIPKQQFDSVIQIILSNNKSLYFISILDTWYSCCWNNILFLITANFI
jgi:hypothetical protein